MKTASSHNSQRSGSRKNREAMRRAFDIWRHWLAKKREGTFSRFQGSRTKEKKGRRRREHCNERCKQKKTADSAVLQRALLSLLMSVGHSLFEWRKLLWEGFCHTTIQQIVYFLQRLSRYCAVILNKVAPTSGVVVMFIHIFINFLRNLGHYVATWVIANVAHCSLIICDEFDTMFRRLRGIFG